MVGAGDLVVPLLGLPRTAGVVLEGAVVILIVATAGMASTTYVQFIKGGLLILFSILLTIYILQKGISNPPHPEFISPRLIEAPVVDGKISFSIVEGYEYIDEKHLGDKRFVMVNRRGPVRWYKVDSMAVERAYLSETLYRSA